MDELDNINIAICDDDEQMRNQVEQWIRKYFHIHHFRVPNILLFSTLNDASFFTLNGAVSE